MGIDTFIPESLKQDFDAFYKARILISILLIYSLIFIGAISWMVFAPTTTVTRLGTILGTVLCFSALCGYVVCLLILRLRGAYNIAAHTTIAVTSASVIGGVLLSGGPLAAPAITMNLLPIMMAFILIDKRGALVWTFIIMTVHIILVLAHITGVRYLQLLAPDMLALQHLAHWLMAYAAMVGLMYAVETLNNRLKRERDVEHQRFEHLATHDPLTNLANRLQFDQNLHKAISRSRRNHKPFGLLMIDLDGFKPINDTLGHDAGDTVLQEISLRLRNTVRDIDTVARIGGDEFAVILEDVSTISKIPPIAEKLCQALQEPIEQLAEQPSVSASIGIAAYPDHALDKARLLKCADIAMYEAKQHKNAWHLYQPEDGN